MSDYLDFRIINAIGARAVIATGASGASDQRERGNLLLPVRQLFDRTVRTTMHL